MSDMSRPEQVRIAALEAAVRFYHDQNADEGGVIKAAQDFEHYIKTGRDRV